MLTPHGYPRPGWGAACRAGATLFLVMISGCVGMVRVKTPTNYLESSHPKVVRVTRQDGQRFIMIGAHLDADTLMGFVQQPNGIHQFQELPLGEISKLEAEQRDPTRTGIAIGAGVVGFGAAWFLLYRQAAKQGTSQFCIGGLYGAGIPCD
jgi:hypothetical protein